MEKNQLPCEVDFSTTSFWVQAHNLPMEYLSKENAKIIGNGMGKFLDVDLARVDKAKLGNFLSPLPLFSKAFGLTGHLW